jgi:hypothetical protein
MALTEDRPCWAPSFGGGLRNRQLAVRRRAGRDPAGCVSLGCRTRASGCGSDHDRYRQPARGRRVSPASLGESVLVTAADFPLPLWVRDAVDERPGLARLRNSRRTARACGQWRIECWERGFGSHHGDSVSDPLPERHFHIIQAVYRVVSPWRTARSVRSHRPHWGRRHG